MAGLSFQAGGPVTLVGVLHLPPLPGAPSGGWPWPQLLERARADATALAEGGVDAILIENFGDAPFAGETVEVVTVAAMTRLAGLVRECVPCPLGINVLRNDALAALAVAQAVEASFIRINVHSGAMLTDQGPLVGRARSTLVARRAWGAASVRLVADVQVKHAVPWGDWDLADLARDTALRGQADVLVVTGRATGQPIQPADLETLAQALPRTPRWVGSGVSPGRLPDGPLDGLIVGTCLHHGGDWTQPVDRDRVRALRKAVDLRWPDRR